MNDSILITGSSRGIGRAIALRLARDGFEVVVHARRPSADADAVVEQVHRAGGRARLLCFDVADRETARRVLEDDVAAHGTYYGLVCNAGITADATFAAMTDEAWDNVLHTHLDGFHNVVKPLVLPLVRRRAPGRIVVMSSVSGLMGNRGQVNYSAAKAGLIGAAKALAVELASRGITVNCVAPGLIDTEMAEEQLDPATLGQIPMRRAGTADEVAALVSFLCSDEAGYITRQVFGVNGGLC